MTIDLAKAEFVNDIFSTGLPDGSIIIINTVDEAVTSPEYTGECIIKGVNIEIQTLTGETVSCPCVIGMGNDLMQIKTDYKDYEGAQP